MSEPTSAAKTGTLYDRAESFGWISIALHWLTGAIVIAMWFIGKNISGQSPADMEAMRHVHVTLGLSAWLLLAGRIAWRIISPHPKAPGQSRQLHEIVRAIHYLMLLALGVMLLSGPLLAWALARGGATEGLLRTVHGGMANLLGMLILVHILGALKHLMFHQDETFERMLWPKKPTP